MLGQVGGLALHLVDLQNQLLVPDPDAGGGPGGYGAEDEVGAAQRVPEVRDFLLEALGAEQRVDGGAGEAVEQLVHHPCRRRGSEADGVEHFRQDEKVNAAPRRGRSS